MSTATAEPTAIALVFDWVLDGQDSLCPIDPDGLSEIEKATLYCYLELIKVVDDSRSPRVTEAQRHLPMGASFEAAATSRLREAIAQLPDEPTVSSLLESPPQSICESVDRLVLSLSQRRGPEKIQLEGLQPGAFQHPEDVAFLVAVKAVPAMSQLVGAVIDFTVRQHELRLLGNAIRVTSHSLPRVHSVYAEACRVLDIDDRPELYVATGPLNAMCIGADRPFLEISGSLLNFLTREELLFVLGHELGHAMSGHAKYHTAALALANVSNGVLSRVTLGLSQLLHDTMLAPTLSAWMRRSEFTADRAGLLACQSPDAAMSVLMKLSGFPLIDFRDLRSETILEQARLFEEAMENSGIDRLRNLASQWSASHPWAVLRAAELLTWVDEGGADELVQAESEERRQMSSVAEQDAAMLRLLNDATTAIRKWGTETLDLSPREASSMARSICYGRTTTIGDTGSGVLLAELLAVKITADELNYRLRIVHSTDELRRYEIPVVTDPRWDNAPKDLRNDFVRHGLEQLTITLYAAEADLPD